MKKAGENYSFDDLQTLAKNSLGEVGGRFELDDRTKDLEFININGKKNVKEIIFTTPQEKLRYLDASDCSIERIIIPANHCNHLKTLYLGRNNLISVVFEAPCPALELLDLSENQLTKLELPAGFDNLKYLYLYKNQLEDLLPLRNYFFKPGIDFVIKENPGLKSPPKEIADQGTAAVINYFNLLKKEKGKEETPLYNFEVKLLLIGEGETGKTTLVRKLKDVNAPLPDDKDSTFGIDINNWTFPLYQENFKHLKNLTQSEMLVNCWDFGGQRIYHGTHQIFFSENSYYILVADTRDDKKTNFSYWFNTIEQLAGDNASVYVVINQKYGHTMNFSFESYQSRFHFLKEYCELNLDNKNGKDKERTEKLQKLQGKIKTQLQGMPQVGIPLPATYVKIRKELFTLAKNLISLGEFREICKKYELEDFETIKVMSKYFHEIGAITHFIDDDQLMDRVFLNSNWLVKTVYKVLDDQRIKKKEGRINFEDIQHIWKQDKLEFDIHHLTRIMHNFGLMYRIKVSGSYVIPAHLPTAQPYGAWIHEKDGNILTFKYEFDKYMPEGLMSHLIVALNEMIENQKYVWNHGVNIKWENSYAEIIETSGGTNTFLINISGEEKRELLAVIRNKFEEILKPFKKLEFLQKVPCRCEVCKTLKDPFFHEYTVLKKLLRLRQDVLCTTSGKMVMIKEILDNIESSERETRIAGDIDPGPKRKRRIFISYSNKDKDLRVLLEEGLKSNLAEKAHIQYDIWSDKEIDLGADWKAEIEKEMKESDAAILLVSANFVSSEFIRTNELAEFMKRKAKDKFLIMPVLVRKYDFAEFETLSSLQFFKTCYKEYGFNKPVVRDKLMPFDVLGDDEKTADQQLHSYYANLAEHVHAAVSRHNFQ